MVGIDLARIDPPIERTKIDHINKLPPEILLRIFSAYIDLLELNNGNILYRLEDLLVLPRVCLRWAEILDKKFFRSIFRVRYRASRSWGMAGGVLVANQWIYKYLKGSQRLGVGNQRTQYLMPVGQNWDAEAMMQSRYTTEYYLPIRAPKWPRRRIAAAIAAGLMD